MIAASVLDAAFVFGRLSVCHCCVAMPARDVLLKPRRLPLIAPSILSADFADMGAECETVLKDGADLLHLDVMDGHFVSNLTMGPAMCAGLRRRFPKACLDVHMMVEDPLRFVSAFADAGATNYTFHIEVVKDAADVADEIHRAGMLAGLAINPSTDVDRILPFVEAVDMVLIMSVNPGYSGQAFIPEVLEKARRLKPMLRANQRLEVDGGVHPKTAAACRDAGCDVLVSASAIFGAKSRSEYARIIAGLRGETSKRPNVQTSKRSTFKRRVSKAAKR
jgi:ribulose-phosphate 3-epimerase